MSLILLHLNLWLRGPEGKRWIFGSPLQVFHTLTRKEKIPAAALEELRILEVKQVVSVLGCWMKVSWSRIGSRTMTASSHKVRRSFTC